MKVHFYVCTVRRLESAMPDLTRVSLGRFLLKIQEAFL